jgi:RNA polymerase sigma-70 factor (ECF subfamily)
MMRSDPFVDPADLVRRVYAYVSYRIGHGPDAEDVTNDVLERALRYRSSYDARRGKPQTWLLGIARHELASFRRPEAAGASPEDLQAPTDIEVESLLRLRVRAAVVALEERDRELIALRYGAELSPAEIAQVLEISRNAADVALHRARARLRDLIGEDVANAD